MTHALPTPCTPCVDAMDITAFCHVDAEGDLVHEDQDQLNTELVAMIRSGYRLEKINVRSVEGNVTTERAAFLIVQKPAPRNRRPRL